MDSLRIRLISAVQESEQDQDSESSTRRQARQDGKNIVDTQLEKVKDPLKYGKLVNNGSGIKCNLCQAVLKAYSKSYRTMKGLKSHLGKSL